ncbi:class I SAM-dependent methyltransferase [Bacillus testis]|uniref:class I SAM-dependent methyltransferase n=1 Tax=Bacillus testis TaxID=1622072 RepID=UPI00067F5BDA|nr:class I SAM-dependent methyltransferase [Bacillus testis]
MKEQIRDNEDVLLMLDELLREKAGFEWDSFYKDRQKGIPFFVDLPDENLVRYFERGWLRPGRALELGCGPGRNAFYLEMRGCTVDAVDSSREAISWAMERAQKRKANVHFITDSIFDICIDEGSYDFVYDSGCFHHIPPHRRGNYLKLIQKALKPQGYFALTCFMVDGPLGGYGQSDWDVYRHFSMRGGLGFTEEKLLDIFHAFHPIEIIPMKKCGPDSSLFGEEGLWTALFCKKG